jgi:hypothetical protein
MGYSIGFDTSFENILKVVDCVLRWRLDDGSYGHDGIRREWTEMVDYLRENRGQEICRGLRGDTRLLGFLIVCTCVCV